MAIFHSFLYVYQGASKSTSDVFQVNPELRLLQLESMLPSKLHLDLPRCPVKTDGRCPNPMGNLRINPVIIVLVGPLHDIPSKIPMESHLRLYTHIKCLMLDYIHARFFHPSQYIHKLSSLCTYMIEYPLLNKIDITSSTKKQGWVLWGAS